MMFLKHLVLALPVMFLVACDDGAQTAGNMAPASGDVVTSADVPAVAAGNPGAAPAPSIAVGEPNPSTPAQCPHQDWVGKTRGDVQAEIDALTVPVRVLYPDSPATMDYNPQRINVILEHGTDRVTEVRCG